MSFRYWLPDTDGQVKELTTEDNSVIIIGANGSGKSKLGAWIEKQKIDEVHRIGAQRNLNFKENIPLKNYAEAETGVFWGGNFSESASKNKIHRYKTPEPNTVTLWDDFDNVLSALLALHNNSVNNFYNSCKTANEAETSWPKLPETVLDKLQKIWSEIFPHRQLIIDDFKFYAVAEGVERYSATQMSDGERSVLYLAAQVLCVPENKIMIIDEPEIHLHRSIMNRTWLMLEKTRPDCLFIYITHDTQFASMHRNAEKIWIHSYNGKTWEYEKITSDDLPEELLFNILGNRNNVLFVEGCESSYDTALYTIIYPNHYVVPCGSCTQVISRTKAFRRCSTIHHCEVHGIIDRDFRSDEELENFRKDGIYSLNVAEVENLFLVEEVLQAIAEHLGRNADETLEKIKSFVIDERFASEIDHQICQSTVAQLKYKLSCIELSGKSGEDVKRSLTDGFQNIEFDKIFTAEGQRYQVVLKNADYAGVLKVFNSKSLLTSIGQYLGIANKEYPATVLNLLSGPLHDKLVNAFSLYMPTNLGG